MVKQERALRTRQALIRAAAEAFVQEGFQAASVARISSCAGVSNGALHFHFPSKAMLADAVEESAAAILQTVTSEPARAGASHLQQLIDITHQLARTLREDVVLRSGFALSGEATREPRTDLRACWRRRIEDEVGRSLACGELREGVHPGWVGAAVMAATVGFEVLGARDAAWLSASTLTKFWLLLLPSLASEAVIADLTTGALPRA